MQESQHHALVSQSYYVGGYRRPTHAEMTVMVMMAFFSQQQRISSKHSRYWHALLRNYWRLLAGRRLICLHYEQSHCSWHASNFRPEGVRGATAFEIMSQWVLLHSDMFFACSKSTTAMGVSGWLEKF